MEDAVRPSKEAFAQILHRSIATWSSHLNAAQTTPSLPSSCFDLQPLIRHTPSFLGYGLLSEPDKIRLEYIETSDEKESRLYVNGYSSWTTSTGIHCQLEPKKLPLKLSLGTHRPLQVQFVKESPLLEWPGGEVKISYVGVLVLTWAYILSVKWMEILKRIHGHESHIMIQEDLSSSHHHEDIEIDLGNGLLDEEVYWWSAILSSSRGYNITTVCKGERYCAPWSISVLDGQQYHFRTKLDMTPFGPPSSADALRYLSRFCNDHDLHDECMAASSAALFIPLSEANSRATIFPIPRNAVNLTTPRNPQEDPVLRLEPLLPYYMTLSCNAWGLRSLLCSTFFEPDVECNLVTPWLNPAFDIINPLIDKQEYVTIVKILASRRPQLASLWLGAVIICVANSTLVEIRMGLMAIEYHAAAWTDTVQSFITLKPTTTGRKDAGKQDAIKREDECRLLFITGGDRFARGPFGVWKPFGETRMEDADLEVQLHSHCGEEHAIKYDYWHWGHIVDGKEVNDTGFATVLSKDIANITEAREQTPSHTLVLECNSADHPSEQLSEHATRGIFSWLRANGYTACEKDIYEHLWLDVQDSDDDSIADDSDA